MSSVAAALLLAVGPALPCSTFMIARDDCLVIAHNLDQEFHTPGMIHANRRSEKKRSVSLSDLGLRDDETPVVEWTSKYGSVTFGMLGRNLPDGGMNEVGLTVSEMGLGESVFPFDTSKPAFLSHLWIQYQLDTYSSVEEVVENLDEFNIETGSTFTPPASANYHLFVTDRDGNLAIIEFLPGGPRVYANGTAPAPVLCNETYERELAKLERYRGVLGWIRRHLSSRDDLRFVTGALAVEAYEGGEDADPVGYAFETLQSMQFPRTKQWSVVYDARNGRVYFRTARGRNTSHFDMKEIDFGRHGRSLVLEDIELDRAGDVSKYFVESTRKSDRRVIAEFLGSLVRFVAKTDDPEAMNRHMVANYGLTFERYIDRALETSELIGSGDRVPPKTGEARSIIRSQSCRCASRRDGPGSESRRR